MLEVCKAVGRKIAIYIIKFRSTRVTIEIKLSKPQLTGCIKD